MNSRPGWASAAHILTGFATSLLVLTCPARTASASTPTNDAAAYRSFDLYADRIAAMNVADHNNITSYPSFLDSDFLLVMRSPADTVGLFNSEPYDAIRMGVDGFAPESYVEYSVSPPLHATSLGLLSMGILVFNGSGAFADYGKPLVTVRVTFTDGDTATALLRVGNQIRQWATSQAFCSGQNPIGYVIPPDDPLTGVVWAEDTNGFYYDVQEILLPPEKRNKKLQTIRVKAALLDHFCSFAIPHLYAGSRLHGISVWPNFTVRNAQNQPVVRQSKNTNRPHGGYLFGSTAVGTRRETDRVACQVASMAMCYTYAGFSCTVDSLNAHLQRNEGYEPSNVAIVTWVSPAGDAIQYRAYTQNDTRLKTDDLFLVERGYYSNPLATFRVTTPGQAVLVQSHNPATPVVEGDIGRVYWNLKRRVADTYTQNPSLVSAELGASPQLPDQVESLLTQGIPVQLNLVTHGHMVVADGWVPSFRPGGTARGTYSIKDPYDPRNFTRLIESRVVSGTPSDYANQFQLARYVVPPGGPQALALASSGAASNGAPSLSVLTNGTWRVELTDPLGRRLLRDAGSGEDVTEIPGAWIMDVGSEHDDGADWDGSQTGYSMDVAEALDGHYVLRLYAEQGHALNVSAYDETGIFSSDAAGDTAIVPAGSSYDLHHSAAARTVAVTWLGPVGVPTPAGMTPHSRLAVRRNPATGPVEFAIGGEPASDDAIEIFDTAGRRVDVARVTMGTQVVRWEWNRVGCAAGVYLARLRSGSGAVRFVVLR